MKTDLTHAELKTKQRTIRDGFPETMGLRIHRSISWIGRAEAYGDDDDARFIFLWIAFNAAYADEGGVPGDPAGRTHRLRRFLWAPVALDQKRRIYGAIWQRFSGPVQLLMDNRHVFNPFWQHHNEITGFEDWEERFKTSSRAFARAVQSGDTKRMLSFVFDRLYVLRNQLVHGGSTWNSAGALMDGFWYPDTVDDPMLSVVRYFGTAEHVFVWRLWLILN